MEKLILDTSALIHNVRGNNTGQNIRDYVGKFESPQLIISVVSIAEVASFMVQNKWGEVNRDEMHQLLDQCIVIDIEKHNDALMSSYKVIDAYSKRKLKGPNGKFMEGSSKTMGKNDIWIAATAHALGATLLSTDGHFDHLNDIFFPFKNSSNHEN
jgi:predicted nucleic acid-binding protein